MVFSTYVKRFSPLWMNQMKVVVAMTGFAGAVVYTGMVPVTHVALACLLASGVIGLCVADILLFRAFQTLGVARTLVLFSFQPMVLGIYGVLFLSQGLNLNQAGAISCMLACLLVFMMERSRLTGKWDIQSFGWALGGILLDAAGVVLTRTAYELTPAMETMQVNLLRCCGAMIGFFLISPRSFVVLKSGFLSLAGRERITIIIACISGTFISLSLYLMALKHAHMASLTSVAITGPLWVSLLECLIEKKLPNRFQIVAFAFFIFGFYLML
jgi:drug/metabolite transporter (DMT)-like permease